MDRTDEPRHPLYRAKSDRPALERRIFTEWLPASGYVYGDAPDIEVYKTPNPADTAFEVWVPVKKAP